MKAASLLDTEVRYLRPDLSPIATTARDVDLASVVRGRPVRRVQSYARQRHYSGLFWSATTGAHVAYESRLELDRILLADFDRDVTYLASQPMWLCGQDGQTKRKHVPDLLIQGPEGYVVCDVKPAKFAVKPEVAAVLQWTGRVCSERGWRYEVWSGADSIVLGNVRWIASGRRSELVDPLAVKALLAVARPGMSIGDVLQLAVQRGPGLRGAKPAMMSLLWSGAWKADLARPLGPNTLITATAGAET